MPRKKHLKIAKVRNLPNVFEHTEEIGKDWYRNYFNNRQPLILEIGCGTGSFLLQLAELSPEKNFVGVDIKGARIWRGAHTAQETALTNVAFLRAPVETIVEYFYPGDVNEIWITFPDPYAKKYNTNRRLTSSLHLKKYREILAPAGLIHLKTDNERLFDFTLRTITAHGCELIRKIDNLHNNSLFSHTALLQTEYEKRYLAERRKIYYLCFRFIQ